jgi:hypothetical protein
MNTKEILEKNPLSTEVVRKWFTDKMFESVQKDDAVPEDFKKFILNERVSNESLIIFIESNPRNLFDVFDDNKIFIEILLYPDGEFTCKIGNEGTTISWKNRKEAEESAIEVAFSILENKLKENGKIIS